MSRAQEAFGFTVPTRLSSKLFYAPSRSDTPQAYSRKFSVYSNDSVSLRRLAHEINGQPNLGPIIMLGTARALDPRMKLGQCFLINRLRVEKEVLQFNFPRELSFLPHAECALFEGTEMSAEMKKELFGHLRCSLVDPYLHYFWKALSQENKERLILVRSVTETAKENLIADNENKKNWAWAENPVRLAAAPARGLAYSTYQNQVSDIFERMMRTSHLVDSIDPISLIIPK